MPFTEDALQAQLRRFEEGLDRALGHIYRKLVLTREDALLLSGRQASWAMPRGRQISNLSEIEFRVFSQFGEDGIIEWLLSHVDVPSRSFVEFGVEDFSEANCRFLLFSRNWRGFVMDSSEARISAIRDDRVFWFHDLAAHCTFVTAENINGLLGEAGFLGPLGVLSIDIDGNDYWVWKAITVVSPAIVICEYNGTLGNTRPIAVPYRADFDRFASHYSGIYGGCSITALQHLAEQRGYSFVGTDSNGNSAFFVRDDLAAPVLDLLGERRAFPPRKQVCRGANGEITFVKGRARLQLIRHLPVIDVATGETLALGEIPNIYTDAWLAEIS